jgi:hypothetical protein
MLPLGNPVTVKVSRPGGTDRHGNPVPGSTFTIDGCAHMPRVSSELNELGRDTVISGEWLFGPVDADLQPQDSVWLPRDDWNADPPWFVDGDVELWQDYPFGVEPDMQCFQTSLTRVEG